MGAPDSSPGAPLLDVRGLSKSYGGVEVLHDADLAVSAGMVHGLVGANGAGKSTLVRILAGLTRPDAGTFAVRRRDGRSGGTIGFVQQDLGVVGELTVRENLQLGGSAPRRLGPLIDHPRERLRAAELLRAVGLAVDPDAPLHALGPGEQALVAVARLFAREHDVVVLDEATATLTRRESDWLLQQMELFAQTGGGVLVVSHRLREIAAYCSEVTLLRDGRISFRGAPPPASRLREMLVGDPRPHGKRQSRLAEPSPLLELKEARADGVGPVDLEVAAGEVVALVGSLSSNLYAIGHLAAGALPVRSGVRRIHPTDGRARVGFLPEDRGALGLFPELELSTNISIAALRKVARAGIVSRRRELGLVDGRIQELAIAPPDPDVLVGTLSGGNQQKALLARAALEEPGLYVLCEPTRSVDIATRESVYRFVERSRDEGVAVLVVTIDIDDALAVADRIGLVVDGCVTASGAAGRLHRRVAPGSRLVNAHRATGPQRRLRPERYGTLVFFFALFAIVGVLRGDAFLSTDNVLLVLGQNSYLAFLACAVTVTLIAGQYDLSVGALTGLSAVLAAGLTANQGVPVPLAVGAVLLTGATAGLLNGALVMLLDVNAFIATLGTGSAFAGLALLYTDGSSIYAGVPESLIDAGNKSILGLPITLVYALALLGALWVLTMQTVTGRYWYALGSNAEAARLAGVPLVRFTLLAFVTTGAVASAGGIVLAARFGSADPGTGGDLLLPAFASAFLGSAILSDGRFRIVGSVLATFLIAFSTNGLEILGVGAFIKPIFNGAVLVLAVVLSRQLGRRRFGGLRT